MPGPCRKILQARLSLPRHAFLPISPAQWGALFCRGEERSGRGPGSWGGAKMCSCLPWVSSRYALPGETPFTLASRWARGKQSHKIAKKKSKKGYETTRKNKQRGHLGKDAVGKISRKPPRLTVGAGRSLERNKPKL